MAIAIIDDDAAVRDSTALILGLLGFETRLFASGPEFLEADLSSFRFLLLDHLMPHMTGLELLAELRSRMCHTPAAIMTGSVSDEVRERANALGACRVFRKPVSEDDLVRTIREAIAA